MDSIDVALPTCPTCRTGMPLMERPALVKYHLSCLTRLPCLTERKSLLSRYIDEVCIECYVDSAVHKTAQHPVP